MTIKTKPPEPAMTLAQAPAPPKHQHPANLRGWFAGAKYLPNMFVPLAVLQHLSYLADDDGVVSLEEAKREMNQEILFAMLRMLGMMGHIEVGPTTITIKTIPQTKDDQ
jgi:hypothetical protein